jgi:hypothetical protein
MNQEQRIEALEGHIEQVTAVLAQMTTAFELLDRQLKSTTARLETHITRELTNRH